MNGDIPEIARWERARLELEEARGVLTVRESAFSVAEMRLGDVATPPDAKTGEIITIKVGDRFLTIYVRSVSGHNPRRYEISWRGEGPGREDPA